MTKKKTVRGAGKTAARVRAKKEARQETQREPTLQAMVWYREEHYDQLLSIFDDAKLLPPVYKEWLGRAEEKRAEVEAAGDQVVKVFIDPDTFPKWCAEKNLKKDANARSQLAIEVAQARSFRL